VKYRSLFARQSTHFRPCIAMARFLTPART
jgi:hypothetical protein